VRNNGGVTDHPALKADGLDFSDFSYIFHRQDLDSISETEKIIVLEQLKIWEAIFHGQKTCCQG
jgi:hypothetical protein